VFRLFGGGKTINQTMHKFGYPDTVVMESDHWCVLLRQEQVTLGCLVLICKENVERFSDISGDAFQEYPKIIREIENTLNKLFNYDKINYLMLMMVDPNVHFHIIPRYSKLKEFENMRFNDYGWPSIPVLSKHQRMKRNLFISLRDFIRVEWLNGQRESQD
jgi:diadenosine tetraphosphate (Ap4A) HIT family hydrolase